MVNFFGPVLTKIPDRIIAQGSEMNYRMETLEVPRGEIPYVLIDRSDFINVRNNRAFPEVAGVVAYNVIAGL
jgi:hypothetical protein